MAGRPPDRRVVHVLEALRGGTSRHVVDVVRWTPETDHHVVVPAPSSTAGGSGAAVDHAAVEAMAAAGASVHPVDMRRSAVHPVNARAVAELRRLIRRVGPSIVHGHSSVGGALARLAAAGTGIPAVYTPNGLATARAAVAVERAQRPLTAALVAVSASEAKLARRLRLVAPDRIHVIPNGIDLAPPPPGRHAPDLRARLGLAPGTPLVGTVARLVAQKAPVDFARVCAAVAAADAEPHFLLVGMGPLQPDLDAAVASSGLGRRFHQLEHLAEASAILGQLDVFVLASRFEGGPYTPLEAMRAGVPVVLSDVVGNADAVLDGITGMLRPCGDVDGLAGCVLALLADQDLRRRLATAATDRLHAEFGAALMGQRLVALYRSLGPARRRTRRLPQAAASSSLHPPDPSASR